MPARRNSSDRLPPGLFVAGTDTGVGKTWVAAQIARQCVAKKLRVGVYKPISSGVADMDSEQQDAWQLWDAAGRPQSLEDVCPVSLAAPLSPHLAARLEGRAIDPESLLDGVRRWSDYDLLIVEGAGGLMSPVTDDWYTADLAYELGYPVLVVAANRLGVINQTLQTLITAAAFRDGLDVCGVVLNDCDDRSDASRDSNFDELKLRCGSPVLAHFKWQQVTSDVDWARLAATPIARD